MIKEFPRRLFVTGTDTGVGKTIISAILVAGLWSHYWKPIQSGVDEMTDTEWVQGATGLPDTNFHRETYRLKSPLSPHTAAAIDGVRIELESFELPETPDYLIVEGAGGIIVPLNEKEFMLDLMIRLQLPILLVVRSGLGTINHTMLSLDQLRRSGLEVFGVVMNGTKNTGNRKAIEHYGKVKVLAEIEPLPEINPEILRQTFDRNFNRG